MYAAEFSLSLSLSLSLGILLSVSAGLAKGQTAPPISNASELKASIADNTPWMYFPGINGQSTVGFLASIDPSVAPRGSFTVVWFQRTAPGVYSMEGWTETSIEDAAAIIAARFNNPDLFEYADLESSPMSVMQQGNGLLALPPETTNNGISENDPWQSVSGSLTPEDVGFLVDNGFAVGARNLSEGGETTTPCIDEYSEQDINLIQNSLLIETALFGAVSPASQPPAGTSCCYVPQLVARCASVNTYGAWSGGTRIVGGQCEYSRTKYEVTVCDTNGCPPYTSTVTNLGLVYKRCTWTPLSADCPARPPC